MYRIFKNPQTGEYAKENDTVKRLILADTMEKIANAPDPVQLFYNGPLAKTMVSEIQANGKYRRGSSSYYYLHWCQSSVARDIFKRGSQNKTGT